MRWLAVHAPGYPAEAVAAKALAAMKARGMGTANRGDERALLVMERFRTAFSLIHASLRNGMLANAVGPPTSGDMDLAVSVLGYR
jgi:hypothetical protein